MKPYSPRTDSPAERQLWAIVKNRGFANDPDPLRRLHRYAVDRLQWLTRDEPAVSVRRYVRALSSKLRVRTEYIYRAEDVFRIQSDYKPWFRRQLFQEFGRDSGVDGLVLPRQPGSKDAPCDYLVVVDARGERSRRAPFTLFHELAHVLILPPDFSFTSYRRSPYSSANRFERLIDRIASELAFDSRLFGPALKASIDVHGDLTFQGISEARRQIDSPASLLSACVAALDYANKPTLLVHAELMPPDPQVAQESARLRVAVTRQFNSSTSALKKIAIRKGMTVPQASALVRAIGRKTDLCVHERQSTWNIRGLNLPDANLRVRARPIRNGSYGLISALD